MRRFSSEKSIFLAIGLAFAAFFPLSALDVPTGKIVDDSSLRIALRDTWLSESPARVLGRRPELRNLGGGGRLELRAEAGRDEFMVILARELSNGQEGSFPGWAQGSWVLTRRRDTGAPTRIRVFLRSDPYTYVQFRPLMEDKCQMDVVIYDAFLVRSLPLPVPFERLYTMPVEEALNLAGGKFPRKYFDPNPDDYRDQRLLISRVRERLGELTFADDGAINENGEYVFIETLESQGLSWLLNTGAESDAPEPGLNCSGFAKWMIDGLLRPFTGERLPIPPLKAPFGGRGISFTDPWEASRDPYFGLDWVRNLASWAGKILRSPAYTSLDEIEVRSERFSQVIVRDKNSAVIRSYPGFLENAGFGIEGLHPLLYTLAIDEPGRFYLAAVNTEMGPPATEENPRGRPRMRQYFHIAALVPYFNEHGNFQVAVFESAEETAFNSFKTRYPGHYVNLVRIPVETGFDP
jgi:hypothetical protein